MAVHSGWLHAILAGHTRVAAGLHIDAPVCVLLSEKSAVPTRWSEELTRADTVLVVDDIARASLRLGDSVTVERIPGALHDIFLSRADARDIAYERLDRWVMGMPRHEAAAARARCLRLSRYDLQNGGGPGGVCRRGTYRRHVPRNPAPEYQARPAMSPSPTSTPAVIAHPTAPPAETTIAPANSPKTHALTTNSSSRELPSRMLTLRARRNE